MTNSNPKSLLKLYKYNNMFSSIEKIEAETENVKEDKDINYKEVMPGETPQKKDP